MLQFFCSILAIIPVVTPCVKMPVQNRIKCQIRREADDPKTGKHYQISKYLEPLLMITAR